jgi:transposase-like protein
MGVSPARKEREQYLKENAEDKGNGYYARTLGTSLGKLNLEVPRTRRENFRAGILPDKYNKRADVSLLNLLYALIYNGYSKEKIVKTLRHLGVSYLEESMREIVEELQQKREDFKNRTLLPDLLFVFIDGYYLQVKDKTKVRKAIL